MATHVQGLTSIENMSHVWESCRSHNSDEEHDDGATNSTDTRSTNTQETEPTQHTQREVSYENVTDLFKAIELGDWNAAHRLVKEEPPQLKVWVKNQGTENTTFEWTLWKRLPLHEACRRQAPVWLVSAMLNGFPEAAFMKTNFGQLPIHAAVECSSSPEVVNLVVLANWEGVLQSDNSGRTPLEILMHGKDKSPLEQYDQEVVQASLERSIKTLTSIHNKCDERIKEQGDAHEADIITLNEKHAKEIKVEQDRQIDLKACLESVEDLVVNLKDEISFLRGETVAHANKGEEWKNRTKKYQHDLNHSRAEAEAHQELVAALKDVISNKDAAIVKLEARLKKLQNDMIVIAVAHDDKLIGQYDQVERDLRTMLDAQIKLKSRLTGQSQALHSLLEHRGITLPPREVPVKKEESKPKKNDWEETPPVGNEAARAAAASALAALKLTDDNHGSG